MEYSTSVILGIIFTGALINFYTTYRNQHLFTKYNSYAILLVGALIYTLLALFIVPLIVGPVNLHKEIKKITWEGHKEIWIIGFLSILSTIIWYHLLSKTSLVRLRMIDYIIDVAITFIGASLLLSFKFTTKHIVGSLFLILALLVFESK